jgi:hypothetical protein
MPAASAAQRGSGGLAPTPPAITEVQTTAAARVSALQRSSLGRPRGGTGVGMIGGAVNRSEPVAASVAHGELHGGVVDATDAVRFVPRLH